MSRRRKGKPATSELTGHPAPIGSRVGIPSASVVGCLGLANAPNADYGGFQNTGC